VADLVRWLGGQLFADEMQVYAVLDGAIIPDLLDRLYGLQPEFICLYRGELAPDLAEVAPYLVRLDPDDEFARWVIEEGWGKSWGVFAVSDGDMYAVRQHFRRFLIVRDPEGKPLYFRYYDPRVLRVYLPTCNADELRTVFGPLACYLLEDADPGVALRFRETPRGLEQERLAVPRD
jgi:hypothetical protein